VEGITARDAKAINILGTQQHPEYWIQEARCTHGRDHDPEPIRVYHRRFWVHVNHILNKEDSSSPYAAGSTESTGSCTWSYLTSSPLRYGGWSVEASTSGMKLEGYRGLRDGSEILGDE
jgi:hypothetical protein